MSDLTNESLPTKIIGATAAGVETNYAAIEADGALGSWYEEGLHASTGKMFSLSVALQALTGTTETPFILFKNPNASGKTAKLYRLTFGPTLGNNYVTYQVYLNPTVTTNGTAITVVGNRQTSQATTVVTPFLNPTVSANGSRIATYTTSGLSGNCLPVNYNFSLWVEANNSILITRDLSANATIAGINIEWLEQ